MAKLKYAEKQAVEQTTFVTLVTFRTPEQEKRFLYLTVPGHKMLAFRGALARGNFNASDYGLALASGSGEPDARLQAAMEQIYGVVHHGAPAFLLDRESTTG